MIIATVFLIIYLITIVSASPAFHTEMATRSALTNFDKDMKQASALADAHYERLYGIVDQVAYVDTVEKIETVLAAYEDDASVGALRFVSQNVIYDYTENGIQPCADADPMIADLAKKNEVGCSVEYFDQSLRKNCIAFFIPVRGSVCIDGLISIVPAMDVISVGETIQESASLVAIVESDGSVLSFLAEDSFEQPVDRTNIRKFLETLTQNSADSDAVMSLLTKEDAEAVELSVGYTVVAQPIRSLSGHAYLVTVSENTRLIPAEFDYTNHIIFVVVLSILALGLGVTFAILFYVKVDTAVANINLNDTVLECPNLEGFKKNAAELLRKNNYQYAVSVLNLKRFHFIEDRFGSKASVDVLKHIKEMMKALCSSHETFGYAGDGKFLMLSDFSNEDVYRNKLQIFEGIINKYELLKENQVKMQIAAGVYAVTKDKKKAVADMIDCATVVCDEAKNNSNLTYVVYTEGTRERISQNEHMEARMEAALSSNEFRLFLQPKYNVEKDEIDSAEALVRWFDYQKGDYRYPAEFISLFESNGFIVEMDHFIYLEVLKYLSEAKSRGDKIVPISVNVSRVTAASPDFISFYVGNKRRYMVDDGIITLEFTESYATDDYEKLSQIVVELHEGGLRCSIDDFGVGYSSFRILKDLQMDELKLDRLFLSKGVDYQRDDMIITTITELARNCGMTVVMEGVETKNMYDRVVRMGIGVIQGYYYAKAIPLEEFKIFVKSNTSIRYKAVVK
jgi:EAL domain-containing protein (putative c-di-GMP-specific phosphodiesterase class I)